MTSITPEFIYTGLLISIAGGIAFSLKAIPGKIWDKVKGRVIYTVKVYQTDFLFDLLEEYMFNNYSNVYREVEATITNGIVNQTQDSPVVKSKYTLKYKQEDNIFIIRLNGKRVVVNKSKAKLEAATNLRDAFYWHYSISGLLAKKEINQMLEGIVAEYNQNIRTSVNIYSNNSYGDWIHANELNVKPFDRVIIDQETKEFLKSDIDEFVSHELWYNERNIPYKRTYCFHGEPGNGKTTIALSIARYINRDVYSMNLNSFEKDEYLLRCFQRIPPNSVVLIEDIDRAFNGRENVDSKISFMSLLNCMDGALYREGTICIITTNHIEKLDPALIRTGRTDVIKEIYKPTPELIGQYLDLFFGVHGSGAKISQLVRRVSMSYVQEVCLQNKKSHQLVINEINNMN